ncbi:hypothetical protein AB0G73_23850 [Streptomyces sp. NPDC020719]|uniref:hypothetical protein n=1 Tax=Streptomyces sp. NPDC020719 TaxID=3154896 RepID=UPI0033F8FD18
MISHSRWAHYGIVITTTSGSRLWVTITSVLAPGARIDDADVPVPGEPLTAVPVPALYQDGKITPRAAEAYLAATLTNSAHPEIRRAYGYTDNAPTRHPGVGIEFHSGAKVYLPFAHTARAGQNRGRERYRLQNDF